MENSSWYYLSYIHATFKNIFTSTEYLMDPRYRQNQSPFDNSDREASGASSDVDSPIAAERFSKAADRITRKIDKIPDQKPPKDRIGTLRFIVFGIILLAVVSILGTITRLWINRLPAAPPVTATTHPLKQTLVASPLPSPSVQQQTMQDTPLALPRNVPDAIVARKRSAFSRAIPATSDRRPPSASHIPAKTRVPLPANDTPPPADASTGEDEPDIDRTIAFYEPVNRSVKSGSFTRQSGRGGTPPGYAGTSATPGKNDKRSYVRTTASLAAKAGGTLDEVLEHNGTYYKIRLTLPVKRIEYFKKSLAIQDAVATLSVTTESTTGSISVIILEMNIR